MQVGFNMRATLAFVTDVAPDTFANAAADAYPVSYPNGVNGGWEQAVGDNQTRNLSTANPRLAGIGANNTTQDTTFRIDLPAAGAYSIQLAAGDTDYAGAEVIEILDTTTSLVSYNTTTGAANSYMDSTGAILTHTAWAAGTNGRGGVLNETFATTILRFTQHESTSGSPLAHVFVSGGGLSPSSGALTLTGQAPATVRGTIIIPGTAKILDWLRELVQWIFFPRLRRAA